MVRPRQHQNRQSIFVFNRFENRLAPLLEFVFKCGKGLPRLFAGKVTFVFGYAQAMTPGIKQAFGEKVGLGEGQCRSNIFNVALCEEIDFFGEGCPNNFRRARYNGTRRVVHRVGYEVRNLRQDGKKDVAQRPRPFGLVGVKQQLMNVRLNDFARKARVDGPVFTAFEPDSLCRGLTEHHVGFGNTEGFEVRS